MQVRRLNAVNQFVENANLAPGYFSAKICLALVRNHQPFTFSPFFLKEEDKHP